MRLIRMVFLAMAVLIPTSWTLAHAGDETKDSGGDMKKDSKKKKKKSDKGDKGDMGGEKKGDMEKK